MPTYTYTSFAPDAFTFPDGGGFSGGNRFQLAPGWDAQNNAYTFAITDDDAIFGGDVEVRDDGGASANEIGSDSGQSAVVTDPGGSTVASGRVYLEAGAAFTDEFGNTVNLYQVEIGGVLVGYIADGPIQPGNTYTVNSLANPQDTAGVQVTYAELHSETYDQDIANSVQGTSDTDTLTTGTGDDTVFGGDGNDTLYAGTGNDYLEGGDGNDELVGDGIWVNLGDLNTGPTGAAADLTVNNSAEDTIEVWYYDSGTGWTLGASVPAGGNAVISTAVGEEWLVVDTNFYYLDVIEVTGTMTYDFGADGLNDTLLGGAGDDDLWGYFGDDTLDGGSGNDLVYGGDGDDTVLLTGADAGNDTIDGGAGYDVLDATGVTVSGTFNITWSNIEEIRGSNTNDNWSWTSDQITFIGGTGNDTINAGTANDIIDGGAGNDEVYGGAGSDTLRGGDGNDTISGGDGADRLYGGAGDDRLEGGTGNDRFYSDAGDDLILGGSGRDVYYAMDGFGNDTVDLGTEEVAIDSGIAREFIDFLDVTSAVTITYSGSGGTATDGTNTITFDNVDGWEAALMAGGSFDARLATFDVTYYDYGGATTAYGSAFNDFIVAYDADASDRYYDGGAGDDVLDTGGGNDTILGGDGNDDIVARGGDDLIEGGAGNDTIYAGDGADTIAGGDGDDYIDGGAGDDFLTTGLGNDTLIGGAGNDTLMNSAGDDSLVGGAGDDVIFSGSQQGTAGLTPVYSEQTGTSDSFTGTNGNSDFTATTTTDGVDIATGTVGSLNGYWVGNAGDDGEVHSHVFSQEIAGAQIRFNAINSGETLYIVIDGQTINLNDAIADGDVTFDGAPNYEIDASGEIVPSAGGDTSQVGTLTINVPFTTIDVANGGFGGNGVVYQLYADTNPPFRSDDDFLSGGDDADTFIIEDNFGNDTIIGGEGGNDDDLIDLSGLTGPVTVSYSGDEAGTITDGNGNTITFSEIERLILTDQADVVDARADSVGVDIDAGAGDDTIEGGDGNDTLFGGLDRDVLVGGEGDDSLNGGEGGDSLIGGNGADTLIGEGGIDTLAGGAGADSLSGGNDRDTFIIEDGFGADTIVGGEGGNDDDTIDLSGLTGSVTVTYTGDEAGTITDGTDTITFSEIERLILTDQADSVDGSLDGAGLDVDAGAGDDTLYGGLANDTLLGGAGADSIWGQEGNDSLSGGDGADIIFGQADADTVDGGAGNDTIYGGDGADSLLGGDDLDTIYGDAGDDRLEGGEGDDLLLGGAGNDTISGDGGNDWIQGGFGTDSLSGGLGNDTLYGDGDDDLIEGGDGLDVLLGGTGNDTISGDAGNDWIQGGFGTDSLSGGLGNDTLYGDGDDDLIEGGDGVDVLSGGDGNDTLSGDGDGDLLQGGAGMDSLLGGAGNDTLYGNGDDDWIEGGDGVDVLVGDTGNDTLIGGDGADSLNAGADNDSVNGGIGNDTIDAGTGDDTVDGGDGNDRVFAWTGNDSVLGGAGDDTIFGQDGNDTIYGGVGNDSLDGDDGAAGADLIFGEDGNDTIIGDAGNDTLSGGAGADSIFAGADDDSVTGDTGNDWISGESGNDTLEGGTGDDTLLGGTGDDTFTYTAGDGNDTIADFNTGNTGTLSDGISTNNDFINLSAFYDDIWELHADQADDGVLNQSNDGVDGVDYANNTSFGSGSLTFTGASADNTSFTSENTGVVCFASGTAIRTPGGEVMVETLRAGDLVTTQDHGPSKVLWIGCTEVALQAGEVDPRRTPVRIKPDVASGARALLVSPQHCLMMTDATGQPVLVRARHLAEETRLAAFAQGRSTETYWHVLLEQHSVLISQSRPSESFYPGPNGLAMMAAPERARLLNALPALRTAPVETAYGPRTMKVLTRSEVRSSARTGAFAFASPQESIVPLPTDYRSQFVA